MTEEQPFKRFLILVEHPEGFIQECSMLGDTLEECIEGIPNADVVYAIEIPLDFDTKPLILKGVELP